MQGKILVEEPMWKDKSISKHWAKYKVYFYLSNIDVELHGKVKQAGQLLTLN